MVIKDKLATRYAIRPSAAERQLDKLIERERRKMEERIAEEEQRQMRDEIDRQRMGGGVITTSDIYTTGTYIPNQIDPTKWATPNTQTWATGTLPVGSTSRDPLTGDLLIWDGRSWARAKDYQAVTNQLEVDHRKGHLPIDWLVEARSHANDSEVLITIQIETDGVIVVGQSGDDYETAITAWENMQSGHENPLIKAIETVERHLATLGRLKQKVA